MQEFTGGRLTTHELMYAMARNEVIAVVVGRSGALRLFILPLSWSDEIDGPYDCFNVDDLPRVSVDDLAKESVTGEIIMDQSAAVVTVSRGVPQGVIVPANRYWRGIVTEKQGGD